MTPCGYLRRAFVRPDITETPAPDFPPASGKAGGGVPPSAPVRHQHEPVGSNLQEEWQAFLAGKIAEQEAGR